MKTIDEVLLDDNRIVIDMRKEAERRKEKFPLAIHLQEENFLEELEESLKSNPKKNHYLLCFSGKKSEDVARELSSKYSNIFAIKNGYKSYLEYKLLHMFDEDASKRLADIERSIIKKFKKDIWRKFTKGINEYQMIEDGDRIACCISGGKDSMLMAKLFQELKKHGRNNFDVVFLVMNPGYNDLNLNMILNNAKLLNIPIEVFESDIFDVVENIEENPCYLCARMRRGHLYSKALELGCNKIALGHHYDDVIETILMGMLYGAQIQTMMPKLHSTSFPGMELIRPLYLIREDDIIHWMNYNDLHFIQCACKLTDGLENDDEISSKRVEIKFLIKALREKSPFIEKNIFRSVCNVNLNTIISYKDKYGKEHNFLDDYKDNPGGWPNIEE